MYAQESRLAIKEEFSLNAGSYGRYNIIQQRVVTRLLQGVSGSPGSVLDLGCGDGAVYKALTWPPRSFTAVDFAPGMLALHPVAPEIETIPGDFNDPGLFEILRGRRFDRIISASALQWAADLEAVFHNIRRLGAPVSFAIFTSGTFAGIHRAAGVPPILPSMEAIMDRAGRYFSPEYALERYELNFPSARDMFRYIKKSGVSGGRGILDYRQAKRLITTYPLRYLEFEVLYMHG
jgi:malonyl-CoA O-methyltransferase